MEGCGAQWSRYRPKYRDSREFKREVGEYWSNS